MALYTEQCFGGSQILYHRPKANFWQCLNSCWEERLPRGLWPLEWGWVCRPGAAPLRSDPLRSRPGFPARLCSETRSRLDAQAVSLLRDRGALSAVPNEWNFLKFSEKAHSFIWVCGGSRLGIADGRSEGNRSGHRDDERAHGFDLNAHSLRSAPNRGLHGAGQLRLLKTAKCFFQTWPGCSLVSAFHIRRPNVVWFLDCADLRSTWARDESLCALI